MPTKPDLQNARRAAYAIWGTLRENPLNSDTATKKIAGLIHAAATIVYDEAVAEIETLEKVATEDRRRLLTWSKHIRRMYERCPCCKVAHSRTHEKDCWMRVASDMATWRTKVGEKL